MLNNKLYNKELHSFEIIDGFLESYSINFTKENELFIKINIEKKEIDKKDATGITIPINIFFNTRKNEKNVEAFNVFKNALDLIINDEKKNKEIKLNVVKQYKEDYRLFNCFLSTKKDIETIKYKLLKDIKINGTITWHLEFYGIDEYNNYNWFRIDFLKIKDSPLLQFNLNKQNIQRL